MKKLNHQSLKRLDEILKQAEFSMDHSSQLDEIARGLEIAQRKDELFWMQYNRELHQKLNEPLSEMATSWRPGFAWMLTLAFISVLVLSISWMVLQPKKSKIALHVASEQDVLLKEWEELDSRGESIVLGDFLSEEEISEYLSQEADMLNQFNSASEVVRRSTFSTPS